MSERQNDAPQQNDQQRSGLGYAAVFALVASILACLVAGWLLDRWLQTSPWLTVGGIILGAVAGFFQFIKIMSKAQQ